MIAVAGHTTVDLRVRPVPRDLQWLGLTTVDVVSLHSGGLVANAGSVIANFGVPVMTLGCIGDDELGAILGDRVRSWATDARLHVVEGVPTSSTIVLVHPSGERTFLHCHGASDDFGTEDVPIATLVDVGVRALHLGYALLLRRLDGARLRSLLTEASGAGLLTSLDVTHGPEMRWEELVPALPLVDVFCPSLAEATAITGLPDRRAAARRLLEMGVRQFVAVTDGNRGCSAATREGWEQDVPPSPVEAVDTTGAGDAFAAAILVSWYRGLDWPQAARVASWVGARAATTIDAVRALPGWEEAVSASIG